VLLPRNRERYSTRSLSPRECVDVRVDAAACRRRYRTLRESRTREDDDARVDRSVNGYDAISMLIDATAINLLPKR